MPRRDNVYCNFASPITPDFYDKCLIGFKTSAEGKRFVVEYLNEITSGGTKIYCESLPIFGLDSTDTDNIKVLTNPMELNMLNLDGGVTFRSNNEKYPIYNAIADVTEITLNFDPTNTGSPTRKIETKDGLLCYSASTPVPICALRDIVFFKETISSTGVQSIAIGLVNQTGDLILRDQCNPSETDPRSQSELVSDNRLNRVKFRLEQVETDTGTATLFVAYHLDKIKAGSSNDLIYTEVFVLQQNDDEKIANFDLGITNLNIDALYFGSKQIGTTTNHKVHNRYTELSSNTYTVGTGNRIIHQTNESGLLTHSEVNAANGTVITGPSSGDGWNRVMSIKQETNGGSVVIGMSDQEAPVG